MGLAEFTGGHLVIEHEGKQYIVKHLQFADWGTLQELCRFQELRTLYRLDIDEDFKTGQLERVYDRCAAKAIDWYSAEWNAWLETIDGMVEVTYLSLRQEQPDISKEEVRSLLTPQNAQIIGKYVSAYLVEQVKEQGKTVGTKKKEKMTLQKST